MFPSDETTQADSPTPATNRTDTIVATTLVVSAARESTRDAGRVHIGGGMMRFDTKDAGRVHVGGGMMRF